MYEGLRPHNPQSQSPRSNKVIHLAEIDSTIISNFRKPPK